MITATGAQIIVTLLEKLGTKVIAGIPGGSTLPLYDELYKSSIKHILMRHEQACGFFAQGISRTTDEVAVCLATSGPGAMNLLTAIADARADSIPLVAITGQVNSSLIGTDAFQEADTFGLSFPITKHSMLIKSPEELLTAIPKAFSIACEGRKGPVLIDIPRDVQLMKAEFDSWPELKIENNTNPRYATEGEDFSRCIESSLQLLEKSSSPVLYVGGGCNNPKTSTALLKFLEKYSAPVVTSLMGIGCIPFDHVSNCGMVGMHGSETANRVMHDSDLVLAIGTRFDDRATGLISGFCPNAKIIHVDIDAAEVNKIFTPVVYVVSEAEKFLKEITKKLISKKEFTSHIEMRKKEIENTLEKCSPGRFISTIPSLAKSAGIQEDDIIVTTDVGQHQMWTAQFYPINKPRQLLTSGSLGTMGFGLPTAIGAAMANPDKRIVCFSGDGSIMMNIQELATLAELNLDVTVIVLDNGVLGMVRQQQHYLFNGNLSASVFEKKPNLLEIAKGFDIVAVDTFTSGWNTIAFPKKGSGPRFVVCKIDPEELVLPFVPGGKANIDAIN